MGYFEFVCQKTLSFIVHSWVHQIHLLYCLRLKMPCWLLGFWLTSLIQKSWVIVLGVLWIDCLAGGGISSKSCKMSLSLDQWSPLSPPTLLGTLQFPVLELLSCLKTWAIALVFLLHLFPPDRHPLANERITKVGVGLSAVPPTGLQQDRWPFSGMTAFAGLKVCCEFVASFQKVSVNTKGLLIAHSL